MHPAVAVLRPAAVAFAALHRAGPDEFFEWQPFLARGITWGIFLPGDETGTLVASLIDASGWNHCIDPQVGSWSRCLLTLNATWLVDTRIPCSVSLN